MLGFPISGADFDSSFAWDGRFADGSKASPGEYKVIAKAMDRAGNESSEEATVTLLSTTWTAPQVVRRLQSLLHDQWSELWRKAKNKKPPPPHPKKKYPKGGHTSVYRVIRDARRAAAKT